MPRIPVVRTIVCFGDSVTQGTPVVAEEDAFPALLGRRLNARGARRGLSFRVINSGVGGENTDEGLARFDRDVAAYSPDLVVVEFGLNEARYDAKARTYEEYGVSLRRLIARLRAISAEIVLTTPNPIIDACHVYSRGVLFYARRGVCNRHVAGYAEVARKVAAEEGVILCDLYRLFEDEALAAEFAGETDEYADLVTLTPFIRHDDGVHPTVRGQGLIALGLYRTIVRSFPRLFEAAGT